MPNEDLKMDMLTRMIVWVFYVVKFFRRQPIDVYKLRKKLEKRDARIKINLPEHMTLKEIELAGVPCQKIQNSQAKDGQLILHLHGGAMCVRSLKTETKPIASFAKRFNASILFPKYRLAPEHKFPSGPDDCFAVYKHLLADGVDPKKVILSGLSAGGGLSLALLALIKRHNLPMPACAILLAPSGDCLFVGDSSFENNASDCFFYTSDVVYYQNLLCTPEQVADPLLNVSLMESFDGYPPMLFSASDSEILRDVSTIAAEKAKQADIPYQLDIYPGGSHGSQFLPTRQATAIWKRIDRFTAQHFPAQD